MTQSLIAIIILSIISITAVALMVFGYHFILKDTRKLSSIGLLDDEFKKEEASKKSRKASIAINSISIAFSVIFLAFCLSGIIYKAQGQQIIINNHTAMVIASNSMEEYYSSEYQNTLTKNVMKAKNVSNEDAIYYLDNTHFNVGDLLIFSSIEKKEDLNLYDVYGYKNNKGQIIVHRLVGVSGDNLIFRGDNTVANDSYVKREQIIYKYESSKINYVGIFVLFFSSSFGIYTIAAVCVVFVMSDIAKHQYNKIKKERLQEVGGKENE